jgi:hypothetical protein
LQSILAQGLVWNLIQGNIHVSSIGVLKIHPAVPSWLSGDVAESLLPERQHSVEVIAIDDDGPDLQMRPFSPPERSPPSDIHRLILKKSGADDLLQAFLAVVDVTLPFPETVK